MEASLSSAMRSAALPAARDRAYGEPKAMTFYQASSILVGRDTSDAPFPACAARSSQVSAPYGRTACSGRLNTRASLLLASSPAHQARAVRRASDSICISPSSPSTREIRGPSCHAPWRFSSTSAAAMNSRANNSRSPITLSSSCHHPDRRPLVIRAAQTTNPPAKTPPSFNNPPSSSGGAGGGAGGSSSPSWTFPPSAPSRYPPAPLSAVPHPSRKQPAVIPLDAEALETLIPRSGSGPQVLQQLGSPPDWLRRFVVSMSGAVLLYNVDVLATVVASFYWAWSPIWSVAIRNTWLRASYRYAGERNGTSRMVRSDLDHSFRSLSRLAHNS